MPKDSTAPAPQPMAAAYPGAEASVKEILALAGSYREAASSLFVSANGAGAVAQAPARLCAIHAVELYLNAYLRKAGEPPEKVRAKLHALDNEAFAVALRLRERTRLHLAWMTENREYLIVRYGPELFGQQSQANRVEATLHEVAKKSEGYFAA